MSKIRVYEIAREYNVESKVLVARLKSHGVDVASHQSTLSPEQIVLARKLAQSDSAPVSNSEAPAAVAASAASATASSKVIRRRKPEEEAASAAPAVTAAPAAPAAPMATTMRRERAPEMTAAEARAAAEAVFKTPPPKEDIAPKVVEEVTPVAPTPEQVVAKSVVEEPQEILVPEEQIDDGSDRGETPIDLGQSVARASAGVESRPPAPAAPMAARPSVGSATIIRREGPPVAQERPVINPQQNRFPPGGGAIVRRMPSDEPSPIRRRGEIDTRSQGTGPGAGGPPRFGNRDAQMRDSGPRGPRPGGTTPNFIPTLSPDDIPSEDTWESRRKPEKKRTTTTVDTSADEAAALAKKAKEKARRDQLNLRSLLTQFDEEDGETEEAPEEDEAAAAAVIRKTVYTPSVHRSKKDARKRKTTKQTQITTPRAAYRVVKMGHEITVGDLARQLSIKAGELIKKLMSQGIMAGLNQTIDFDTASIIAGEYQFEVQSNVVSVDDLLAKYRERANVAEKKPRPSIVTIMGHVDHGKTSILDAIRKSKVAEGEAGGITQHIGAYWVKHRDSLITFLDTPGHEAFSAMRARGADLTDIVILVVAADDGVMPQTIEAISHAKSAGVPIIVAVNKMDKPGANLDRVYRELMEQGIQSEEWGGEIQFVKVSALKRTGIDELLEAVLLQSEVLELQAPEDCPANGAVVEAHLDKGRGPVATVVVQEGTLRVGDILVAGTQSGKVRAMHDHTGARVLEAKPSMPVEVIGLAGVPMAGDKVNVVENERDAKEVIDIREVEEQAKNRNKSSAATLDQLLGKIQQSEVPEVAIILKADTQGSVEALAESILKLNTEKVRNRIVHKAVGGVTESDISLAMATNAIIIGFNVRASRGLDDVAEKQGVIVNYFSVIYDVVDTLKSVMAGKLPPIKKEVVIGHAEVRQTISVPKVGTVAGSAVLDGKITRNALLRLVRADVVIYSGRIGSLRRFKDDVKEVAQGYECGISIDGYNDVRESDVIEAYVIEEQAPTL